MEKEGWASNEEGPQVYLLTEPGDVAQVEPLLRPEHRPLLQAVNFDTHAVVALFRGGGICAGVSAVTIDRLILHENTLSVQATFSDPAPDRACKQDTLMPYHLVRIEDTDMSLQELQIVLEIQKIELR